MRTMLEEILAGDPLTPREKDVLVGAAIGESSAVTARRMHLSAETVRTYRKRAIAKLRARNIAHAVTISICTGIVTRNDLDLPGRT